MRVMHVGKYFPPFPGGIENYCADLLAQLRTDGVDARILVHAHSKAEPQRYPEYVNAVPTWGTLAFTPIAPGFRAALHRAINLWQPQLLHFHLPNPSALWALSLSSARALPWIAHWHSDIVASKHERRLRYLYRVYQPFEKAFLNRCSAVVATSPPYAESSEPLRQHRDKVHVIPLGIAEDALQTTADAPDWPSESKLRLLAVGRLTYYKGYEILLNALSSCPEVQLLIVGDGELKTQLQQQIQQLDLSDRVAIQAKLSDPQRNRLLQQCDVFCLPSIERTEAFGLVLLEAMAAGKPTIASHIQGSGVPWVIEHGANGHLVKPSVASDLAKAINTFCDPVLRQQLSTQAISNFRRKFSIGQSALETIKLYRKLLA